MSDSAPLDAIFASENKNWAKFSPFEENMSGKTSAENGGPFRVGLGGEKIQAHAIVQPD